MTRPRRFLIRMIVFLVAVGALAVVLFEPTQRAFMANPALNGLILGVMLVGVGYGFRQVLLLGSEITWLETYQHARKSAAVAPPEPPALLAPMAAMLEQRRGRGSLSALGSRAILDSIGARLDESREISRYLTGLLIFLGLLGTFWGLLETVTAVGGAIASLNVGGAGDAGQLFDTLKRGLESPLAGMGTAFSSSLFGLSGSLVLGFLDLQAGQAQNRFYKELEDWLAGMTRVGAVGPAAEGEQSVPAYVQALLEQTADGLDNLQRAMSRAEENRAGANTALLQLTDRLSTLTDQMRAEQELLVKLAEHQMELKPVLAKLAAQGESGGLDQASRTHLRNLDVYVARLLEESAEGRNRLVEEMRAEIKLLARTIAAAAEERQREGRPRAL
jgi:hypothetical protein